MLIEALNEADWFFRYRDGMLQEFRLGSTADVCRIQYSGRGLPLYLSNQTEVVPNLGQVAVIV